MPVPPARGASFLLPFLLTACPPAPETGDTSDVPPGSASLDVRVLSADEIAASLTLPEGGNGTLTCGQASTSVVGGLSVAYLSGFPAGSSFTCVASSGAVQSDPVEVTLPAAVSPGLVLFDAGHGETSGNADWVIDNDTPSPSPTDPDSPEDWRGAFSSFGYGLHTLGYEVRTLTRQISASELASAQVLVLPEPNGEFTDGEVDAIASFVDAGGALVVFTNHHGSDRDSDGIDANDALAPIFAAIPAGIRDPGESWDTGNEQNTTASIGLSGDPILHGRSGEVERVDFFQAASFRIDELPQSRRVIGVPGQPEVSYVVRVAAGYAGQGRLLAFPDSAAADDGTGASGDDLYDGWSEYDNAALFLNGVDWAAGVR